MRQTLHQSKCHESAMKARKATRATTKKTQTKLAATRNKLRKKTYGY